MGRFKKGESGNPNGRPKTVGFIQELAREKTETAIKKIIDLMDFSEDEGVQLRAAQAILDRGWGKPSQQMDLSATPELTQSLLRVVRNGNKDG